jgi:hypothetical protein
VILPCRTTLPAQRNWTRRRRNPLHAFEGLFQVITHVKELVELRDREDFVDVRSDGAEPKLALRGLHLLIHRDQLAESGARQILNIGEIENDLLPSIVLNQAEKLVSDDLNVAFVENLLVNEFGNRDVTRLFKLSWNSEINSGAIGATFIGIGFGHKNRSAAKKITLTLRPADKDFVKYLWIRGQLPRRSSVIMRIRNP